MRASLARWVSDADAVKHREYFRVTPTPADLEYLIARFDDYYVGLINELFDRMRVEYGVSKDWDRLGNALADCARSDRAGLRTQLGISRDEALFFAATAFYCGGYPASACLTARQVDGAGLSETYATCLELLGRPAQFQSPTGRLLLSAIGAGELANVAEAEVLAGQAAAEALHLGPDEWIPARLLQTLVGRLRACNVRAVLPDGAAPFWNPFVSSLLNRRPPQWEFFPSQIQAIESGLLTDARPFSLQMPTGAGKTAICETLLYWHLNRNPADAAVLLVPFRSLASELRLTLVKRLNKLGLSARCAYAGTVPTGDEVHALEDARVVVATPEALSGLLSAAPDFFSRIGLVICDEGHLLAAPGRGVGLELLLSRFLGRPSGPPRFVFVSAIVPNIEEVNSWLGGEADTVVRSTYKPAQTEYAVLRPSGAGAAMSVGLDMHPHEEEPIRFSIDGFLRREAFTWTNPATRRRNTFGFDSIKTQAVAAARKALPMGAVALFSANKRGQRGVVGLTEELLEQLDRGLGLPIPAAFSNQEHLEPVSAYFSAEYGAGWLGTRAIAAGIALHHGDIPQETREVIERLLVDGDIKLAICTNTLAEGVNLPIRTLVLYSIARQGRDGSEMLLARDIKNLVGRAGRPGATTKGLVICADPAQWPLLRKVAREEPGEPVVGALRLLLGRLRGALARQTRELTNEALEATPVLTTLVDGIDATLVDLAVEEIGEDALVEIAMELADGTFAARQAEGGHDDLLKRVFGLRARRVAAIRAAGRLGWIRDSGARCRILASVEDELLPMRAAWDDVVSPLEPAFVRQIVDWAWLQPDLQLAVREAYRLGPHDDMGAARDSFRSVIGAWLAGDSFVQIADGARLTVDELLGVHSRVVTYVLQTIVEQGIALLAKLAVERGGELAQAVIDFPDHLRFGVPTASARLLAAAGLRHRRAVVALGNTDELQAVAAEQPTSLPEVARTLLGTAPDLWRGRLGGLVFENTLRDLPEGET